MKQATIEDLQRFIEPAKWFHQQTKIAGEFHKNYFLFYWEEAMRQGSGLVFYTERDGKVVEAIGVRIGLAMFDGAAVATVAFWFTEDDRNGLGLGLMFNRLLAEMIDRRIKRISLSALYSYRFEQVSVFLERAGFTAKEVFFQREVA